FVVTVSLVILMSRFEVTRGLFWDGPRNFESWSDEEGRAWAGTPDQNSRTTPAGGRLPPTAYPHTRRIFGGIGFRSWGPPAPRFYH
ncbi:hypothetical protein AVEN_171693-1, partial [Araneus ventricosus]